MIGRRESRAVIDALLDAASQSRAATLTLLGEPGIGKTLLCDYALARARARGFTAIAVAGVQWESEFELAALTQLLTPMRDFAGGLTPSQRLQLDSAFGARHNELPDPLGFAATALACIVRAAEDRPLLLVIDDVQWLDAASAAVLGFVVRRLCADSVAVLFAHRSGEPEQLPDHWPRHEVPPLGAHEICDLVAALRPDLPAVTPSVAAIIRERAAGNPLAVHELAPRLDAEQTTGARHVPDPLPLGDRGQLTFGSRIAGMDCRTRRALAVVAVAGSQTMLIPCALELAGLNLADLDLAIDNGVLAGTTPHQFTHPLWRSAAYAGVAASERHMIHQMFADLNFDRDPERYARHLDAAAGDPDSAAAALEQAAHAIAGRAGTGLAAATWARSAELTVDPSVRRRRAMRAAAGYFAAGAPEACSRWLAEVPVPQCGITGNDAVERAVAAEAMLQQCELAVWQMAGTDRLRELIHTAERLASVDHGRAARAFTLLATAFENCGAFAAAHNLSCRAAQFAARLSDQDRFAATCWAAHTDTLTCGSSVAMKVARLVPLDRVAILAEHSPTSLWSIAQTAQWQEDFAYALTVCKIAVAALRRGGNIAWLPHALTVQSQVMWYLGAWNHSRAAITEALALAEEIGHRGLLSYTQAVAGRLAGATGRGDECLTYLRGARELSEGTELGPLQIFIEHAYGLYELSRERPATAARHLARAHRLAVDFQLVQPVVQYLADYVEALIRAGRAADAHDVLDQFDAICQRSGSKWAEATALRCRAMLDPDTQTSEDLLRDSVDRLTSDLDMPFEANRSRLELGAQLRRRRRLAEARQQLRSASDGFRALNATAWAHRADAERRAAGDRDTDCTNQARSGMDALSPQQLQVVLTVAAGATNREAAAALFISPKTVDYHLRRACTTLGVRSRVELARLVASSST